MHESTTYLSAGAGRRLSGLEDEAQEEADDGTPDGAHAANHPIFVIYALIVRAAPQHDGGYDEEVEEVAEDFVDKDNFVHNDLGN